MAGDHVHLLVQPFGLSDISDFIGSLKRNVSRDINDMIQNNPRTRISAADDSNRPLPGNSETIRASIEAMKAAHPALGVATLERHFQLMRELRIRFRTSSQLGAQPMEFRWQGSFNDYVIRSEDEFSQHLEYIFGNAVKHRLTAAAEDWRWMWIFGTDEPLEFQ